MSKHTPGPWEFDAWGDIRAGHDTVICGMGKSCGLKSEYTTEPKVVRLANARLIAAAPDLYDAAHRAEWWLSTITGSEAIRNVLRAAIAKAEGRT